jgi:hypothetical protein
MTPLRIASKALAHFHKPDACARCLWLKLKVGQKLPYQSFPGIFNSIDAYTKRVVAFAVAQQFLHQPWLMALPPLAGPVAVPHHSKYQVQHQASGILLTGAPDAIFQCRDKAHILLDYKTAVYSAKQAALLPFYTAQLHAYKYIGERTGFAPIERLYLVYAQPLTEQLHAHDRGNHTHGGFKLGFQLHTHEILYQPGLIDGLLAMARGLFERATAPTGRPGCEDCTALEGIRACLN